MSTKDKNENTTTLTDRKVRLGYALAEHFYEVVPLKYQTYCALTSSILKNVLHLFGIKAELVPCQVWCVSHESNFVVGFLDVAPKLHKWNGHVVCDAGDFIIDAAIKHFDIEFGLTVPAIVRSRKFLVPTQVISRHNLNERLQLWWHHPPEGVDVTIPNEPSELITKYATQLVERLSEGCNIPSDALTH